MANRSFKQFQMTLEGGVVKLYGYITIGSSGAISASGCKGFSVAKTATKTGRYTLTLEDKYMALLAAQFTVQGPADAAFGTTCGSLAFIRGEDVAAAGGTPLLYLQIAGATTSPADTEAPSGTKVFIELTLKNSTAY